MELAEFMWSDKTYFEGGIHNVENLDDEINRWFDYMKRGLITKEEFGKWLENIRLEILCQNSQK
jgi:hypothetical protein